MKPRSRLILILSLGAIALVIGIILGMFDNVAEFFNIPPTAIDAFERFIEQYVAGMPVPPPIV
ncbi:MAG: hypothetical protein FK730_11085 [Asgard group archaeon]|nr:hypothetical protein [Asgard group archaeon]